MVARNLARRVSSTGPPAKSADRPVSGLNTGLMQFTRMLSGPSSAAIDLLVVMTAPLEPLYQVSPGRGRRPAGGGGAEAGGGGDVDEAAAAGFAHRRHGVDGAQVDAFHVDGVDLVELVFADFEQGAVGVCRAGVVDHHVEPPVAAQGFVDQGLDLGGAGHVGLEEAGCAACGGDVGHHALAAGGIDVVDYDFAAFSVQEFGDAFADAAAGAGDDDGLVLHAHGGLLGVYPVLPAASAAGCCAAAGAVPALPRP